MKKSCESEFFKWQEANINEGRIVGREEGRIVGREEGREEGRKEGRKEGKIEGKIEIIKELLKSMTPKEIAEKTNTPLTEIQKIAKQ